jgi:hypothetical protein
MVTFTYIPIEDIDNELSSVGWIMLIYIGGRSSNFDHPTYLL